MLIEFFCPRWGSEELSWEIFCEKASSAGYNGFVVGVAGPASGTDLYEVWDTS